MWRGFTLVELMMTLTVAAVLLGVAVPSFAALLREARLSVVANDLHAAIFFTRSEAIKHGRRVTICTSADALSCGIGIGWHAGWIVFDDRNGNGLRESDETIMRVGAAQPPGLIVTGNTPLRNHVSYIATGKTRSVSGALQMGTITACENGRARQIVINAAGRPRVVRDAHC